MANKNTLKAIEDFLLVESDKIIKAPLVLIFGGSDLGLSNRVVELFKKGCCQYILISGGKNKALKNEGTEADWHCANLVKQGIPRQKILLEGKATNSLENVTLSKKIIKKQFGKLPDKMIIVCKAFHGRRVLMTLRKNLSPNIEYNMQLVQTKNHQVASWYKNKKIRNHIIDEIRKIGEYTLKGDLEWK